MTDKPYTPGRDVAAALNGAKVGRPEPFGKNGHTPVSAIGRNAQSKRQQPPLRFPLLTIEDLDNLTAPKSLIGELLDEECLAFLYGRSGRWKSFLALSWALAIAHGRDWLGHPTLAGAVVYITFEGKHQYKNRIEAWRRYYCVKDISPRFMLIPGGVHLLNAEHVDGLIATIQESVAAKSGALGSDPPVLVVIDTLARSLAGGDENKTADAESLIAAADAVRNALHCTTLFVHHTGHEQSRMRGNSVFFNDADVVMKLTAASDAPHITCGDVVRLTSEKVKDHDPFAPLALTTERLSWNDPTTGDPLSSLVITRAGVTYSDAVAPDAPSAPPKKDFSEAQRLAWRELAKFCAHTPQGALYSEWMKLSTSKGYMVESTFRAARSHLMATGWVIKEDKRHRAVTPGHHAPNDAAHRDPLGLKGGDDDDDTIDADTE